MKLLFCPKCQDIRKLGSNPNHKNYCECGAAWGCYEKDKLSAVVGGEGIPIGIENQSFARALKGRPVKGDGAVFVAFVIPEETKTIRYEV